MEILERFGINSEVICAFFGVLIGYLIGITPTILKRHGKKEGRDGKRST